jgi:four helix bundle protein
MKADQNISDCHKSGYKYLLVYKITVPIYDLTVEFCNRYIPKLTRTNDQMVQAARSGMQNIAEGNRQQSLSDYIKLRGIGRRVTGRTP